MISRSGTPTCRAFKDQENKRRTSTAHTGRGSSYTPACKGHNKTTAVLPSSTRQESVGYRHPPTNTSSAQGLRYLKSIRLFWQAHLSEARPQLSWTHHGQPQQQGAALPLHLRKRVRQGRRKNPARLPCDLREKKKKHVCACQSVIKQGY